MAGRRTYDVMYRLGLARAFWSRADRWEIRGLVEDGPCDPARLTPPSSGRPRAIDLGCGEGGVTVYLAQHGFETVGVDFSEVALRSARMAAARAGLESGDIRFVQGDLTGSSIPGVEGPFDLLVDLAGLLAWRPRESSPGNWRPSSAPGGRSSASRARAVASSLRSC
jgi:SAM-dependent methyltransferase